MPFLVFISILKKSKSLTCTQIAQTRMNISKINEFLCPKIFIFKIKYNFRNKYENTQITVHAYFKSTPKVIAIRTACFLIFII